MRTIKVLVVEDSSVQADLLAHMLRSDEEIEVVGIARTGKEAIEATIQKRPDVIAMDVNMPLMNGFDATRKIMEMIPTPIVIVSSSYDPKESSLTFRAIEAGALAIVAKPPGNGHDDYERTRNEFLQTIKLMSEVRVVRRWPKKKHLGAGSESTAEITPLTEQIRIIALGGSTGGPIVLQTILSSLPKGFPVPIVIAQHLAAGFLAGFTTWLTQSTGFPVYIAIHGENLVSGRAYVAPDGFQMGVSDSRIVLTQEEPENGHRPSVSYLFRSVAAAYGAKSAAVLLTGMGRDGADGLKALKDKGAVTIAQDKNSSVVFGMPGEAILLGAARYVLPPDKIASELNIMVRRQQ